MDSYLETNGEREMPDSASVEMAAETAISLPLIVAHEIEAGAATATNLSSPLETHGWRVERRDGIETFIAPDDTDYVRARPDEDADVIVHFTRIPGITDMRLVEASESATVKRAARKKRREQRALRARGYDV